MRSRCLWLPLALVGCAPAPRAAAVVAAGPVEVPSPPRVRPVAAPRWVPGDGPLELSVEDAVLLVLENNRDLHLHRLTPEIVGAFERIEAGAFHPQLFAEIDYETEDASETARSTGERFDVSGQGTAGRVGVRQRIPSGTTLEAAVEHRFTTSSRTPEQQGARLGVTLTQSLLRGFGPAVNLAGVRSAELDTAASIYELRAFVEALVAGTEVAYWRYGLAVRQIEIVERSLAVAKNQLCDVENRIAVGRLAELEAHASRAEVALREQAVIDARSELEAARLRLARMVAPDREGRLEVAVVATSELPVPVEPINDVAERLELAQQSRPDLKEALLRQEQRRLETVTTSNGLLPRLDIFVTLGKTGFATAFGESFAGLADDTFDFAAGLRLDYALGGAAASGRDHAAYATHRQAAEAVANLRQLIELDVRLAANEVDRARQQIAATAATRELQERTVAAETERFEVGVGTALFVAQAQRDLLASEIAAVEAIVDYRAALVKLYLAEGTLLERRGLRLDEQEARGLP